MSGAGQVLHPTYEAGHSTRDPDDYFTPWGVSLRDPDRDAHGDAQVVSGAGQVLHPTYEAGRSMRGPGDHFSPWGVSARAYSPGTSSGTPGARRPKWAAMRAGTFRSVSM